MACALFAMWTCVSVQASECSSIGLSSSGLSNYKWDPESPSAHKHKNSCQTTLSVFLSLSLFVCLFSVRLSLFCSRLINSSPNRFVRNLFFSGFLDFRQNVRYWWAHSEGTGCGVFCISVLVPEKSSWLSLIVQLALVSVSVWSLRKLSRCC